MFALYLSIKYAGELDRRQNLMEVFFSDGDIIFRCQTDDDYDLTALAHGERSLYVIKVHFGRAKLYLLDVERLFKVAWRICPCMYDLMMIGYKNNEIKMGLSKMRKQIRK